MKYLKIVPLVFLLFSFYQGFSQADYYWVGGQGAWADLNSWRLVSGEIPNEIPDAQDNIIFNENSFLQPNDTVFIKTSNPACNSFTFVNIQMPVVIEGGIAGSTYFNVYGSITLHPLVTNNYLGQINLLSAESGNTISCAGSRFAGDLNFNGPGEWILLDTLVVFDTIDWEAVVFDNAEIVVPKGNPIINHNNGKLDADEQVIACMGLSTATNNPREIIIENCNIYVIGNVNASAEQNTFSAANSYFLIAGDMNNFAGENIYYHDVDFKWPMGSIKNTDIRSHHRKIFFMGSGDVSGKRTPGIEGSATIDTLIYTGFNDPIAGPIPNVLNGPYFDIHYTQVNLTSGMVDIKESFLHRIDYNCPMDSYLAGPDNEADTVQFISCIGLVSGMNTVSELLKFNMEGALSSEVGRKSDINHAVFGADGSFGGNNEIIWLTLSTGFWYQIQIDSLIQPGSVPTVTYKQTIKEELEVVGDCNKGLSIITSGKKETPAFIDFQGTSITTEYIMARDVQNVGNVITVEKGIDVANNEGFNWVDSHESRTLYWIEGSGDWGDDAHWSLDGSIGGECPPTILDDVYFNANSFPGGGSVNIVNKYALCRDIIWEDDVSGMPTLTGEDSCNLRVWGSLQFSENMVYDFDGKVYFESEDDEEYETLEMTNGGTLEFGSQTFFYGPGGKWRLLSDLTNMSDTLYFKMGALEVPQRTLDLYNFNADDTLNRELYLLDTCLVQLHQYNADAWVLNTFGIEKEEDPNLIFESGRSTIRSIGDISPPIGSPPGLCHIKTYIGNGAIYYNIEFMEGEKSILKSEAQTFYHLVDYYCEYGEAIGNGDIDTLTYQESAYGCRIKNVYEIDFVIAYSDGDTLIGNHIIDTVLFYGDMAALYGYHKIGYLQADKFISTLFENEIDTAVFKGNAEIYGSNTYLKLELYPNKRYKFQHDPDSKEANTHTIVKDFVVNGYCDGPIRITSDSAGRQANILYLAEEPTYPDFTFNFASIRDINMVDNNGMEYIADNFIDLGNNTNISFTGQSLEGEYYWVGGSGDWGDWQHWSYESGGEPIAALCTPKEINTVIFDDNSFTSPDDVVFIDVLNAYCNDMLWLNTDANHPTFIGPDTAVLFVYGDLQLNENMNYKFYGEIFFDHIPVLAPELPNHFYSAGHDILNDIHFSGIDDEVILDDDITLLWTDPDDPTVFEYVNAWLEFGSLNLNENRLDCRLFYSNFKHNRTLNMEESEVVLRMENDTSWYMDGTNLNLLAENSTIYDSADKGTIFTHHGDFLEYYDIVLANPDDVLANSFNQVEYNMVYMDGASSKLRGNYITDSILMRNNSCLMENNSITNVVMVEDSFCNIKSVLPYLHDINHCIVKAPAYVQGRNQIEKGLFHSLAWFFGQNLFDTLVLYPGAGNVDGVGNSFYFQSDSTQIVVDSLRLRGIQCSSIALHSMGAPNEAYIRMDESQYPIDCDYLDIYDVGTLSDNDVEFFAGSNSKSLPFEDPVPESWILDNSQGYVDGFNGKTEYFCKGENYIIDGDVFSGDDNTQYFWNGSPYPGGTNYPISQPGTYTISVEYYADCVVDDYIIIAEDVGPDAVIPPGPYCEGWEIPVEVNPGNGNYEYQWSTGETSDRIEASLALNGTGIFVEVMDKTNNCVTTPNRTVVVNPTPIPQNSLGTENEWIDFGSEITMDAGPGDSYSWTSSPDVSIPNSDQSTITVPGQLNPIVYKVEVILDGCPGDGFKIVNMFQPNSYGVPTAFSPNNDDDNDRLYVYGTQFKELIFRIYNRYGEMLFETNDELRGWDGKHNGFQQEKDVYTYYLKIIFADGGLVEETGNVTLLR